MNQVRIYDNSIFFIDENNTEHARISTDQYGNLSVCSGKISNVLTPTDDHQAVNKKYVDIRLNKKYLGLEYVQNIKNNNAAITPPTQLDNLSKGYITGSRWIDIINKTEYVCYNSTFVSANWVQTNNNKNLEDNINNHIKDTNNPHKVNKHHIGLSDVENIKNNYNADQPPTNKDNLTLGYTVGSRWIDQVNKTEYLCFMSTLDDSCWLFSNNNNNNTNNILLTHTDNYNNPHKVTKAQIGLSDVENIKNNLIADENPQCCHDIFLKYSIGSVWINNVSSKIFICTNNTLNKACWKEVTNLPELYGVNLGSGSTVYSNKIDNKLLFKSIKPGNYLKIDDKDNTQLVIHAKNSHSFSFGHVPVDVIDDKYSTIFYFPWSKEEFKTYNNGKIIFYTESGHSNLSVQMYNKFEDTILGCIANINTPGVFSFTISNPSKDTLLEIQVKRSINYGIPPRIYGVVLKYES